MCGDATTHDAPLLQVEGTCSGRYGFIVMVTDIKSVGEVRAAARGALAAVFLLVTEGDETVPLTRRPCGSCVLCGVRVSQGVIQDTTAFAKFHVKYTCIVFRPFKGEVLDCIVTSVNKARRRGVCSPHRRPTRRGRGVGLLTAGAGGRGCCPRCGVPKTLVRR